MKKIALHIQILLAMALGILFAIVNSTMGWPSSFSSSYIKPFGTLFLNSLKMVSMPLVLASLIVGVTSIGDAKKLSRIGGKTFLLYAITTIFSASLGIIIANFIQPGKVISEQTRQRLTTLYRGDATKCSIQAEQLLSKDGPLEPIVKLVPENFFHALTNNLNLLQIVIVAIFLGIALLKIPTRKSAPVIAFFEGINEAVIELIRLMMRLAPLGVFSLISSLLIEIAGENVDIFEILYALLGYVATVIGGLSSVLFLVYPIILKLFTKINIIPFLKALYPAQLVAFTTSSSSAALPVTMECAEKKLGVAEEISSFVLPLGATVNMNGTALYQSIVTVFVAQTLGIELSLATQCMIVANVTFSSIGVAGVPGAGMVMTTLVFQSINIPVAGIALIFAPDRIIDMYRTVVNITGDALVATVVASSEGEIVDEMDVALIENEDY